MLRRSGCLCNRTRGRPNQTWRKIFNEYKNEMQSVNRMKPKKVAKDRSRRENSSPDVPERTIGTTSK